MTNHICTCCAAGDPNRCSQPNPMTANPVTAQDALKNCPFCRRSGQRTDHLDSDDKIRQSNVRCKPCGYTVPLSVWNRRADLAQPRNDAEVVRKAVEALEMVIKKSFPCQDVNFMTTGSFMLPEFKKIKDALAALQSTQKEGIP